MAKAKKSENENEKATSSKKGGTKLASCVCTHEYQDAAYGTNIRVYNVGMTKSACTVCGKTK